MRFSPTEHSLETHDLDQSVPDLVSGHFQEGPGYRVLRRRGATSWLLTFTLSGAGLHQTELFVQRAEPGTWTLWAPRHYQEYATDPKAGHWEFHWVHFLPRPHWRHFLDWEGAEGGLRTSRAHLHDAEARLQTLHARLAQGRALDREAAQAWLELLLIDLRQAMPAASRTGDEAIDQAVAHGLAHLGEALSIPDLAGRVGLSPSRFAERFQKVMGITPRIFFEQERLGRARQMLRMTNLPVKSIAAQLGFRSELYFSSRFRALTGVPPTAYRRAEAERESPGSG